MAELLMEMVLQGQHALGQDRHDALKHCTDHYNNNDLDRLFDYTDKRAKFSVA